MKFNILAVILARGGSKGIPKKNIYKICDHPLISYSIFAAKKSKKINRLVVSTDSKEIAHQAKLYGAEIPFLRSKKLSGDRVPSMNALRDCVIKSEKIFGEKYDFIIELPCVSPFRDCCDIDKALTILTKKNCDSVISYVNTGEKHPTRLKRIKNNQVNNFCLDYPEPDIGSRRQDFEPCYIRNGAIYAMTRDCIINQKSRNGRRSYPLVMPQEKSINIDEKFDLKIAELMIREGLCNNKPVTIKTKSKVNYYQNIKKKNLLISTPVHFLKNEINKAKKKFNIKILVNPDKEYLKLNIKNTHFWICQPCPEYLIDSQILSFANNLKVIATPSTGVTHIDLNFCKKKNIKVIPITHNKAYNTIKASSEYTFLLILNSLKNFFNGYLKVKQGYWRNTENILRGYELYNKKISILGYGRIGKNLVKYLEPFDCDIKVFDPYVNIPKEYAEKNLKRFLKRADIFIVCISYNKRNKKVINEDYFRSLKKGVIFINSSRGENINEGKLLKYLKNKKISLALLDVIQGEQQLNKKNSKLIDYMKKNKNLIITPHIAGLTYESEKKAFNICLENICNYVDDKKK